MDANLPPVRFDHPFAGQLVVNSNYGGEISAFDGPCYPWMGAHACSKVELDKSYKLVCRVFAQHGKLTASLLRHEIAHCNGWAADHPK